MNKYLLVTLLGCAPLIILTLSSGVSYFATSSAPVDQSPLPTVETTTVKKELGASQTYSNRNDKVIDEAVKLHLSGDLKDLTLDWRGSTQEVSDACEQMRRVQETCQRIAELMELTGGPALTEITELNAWIGKHQGNARKELIEAIQSRVADLKLTVDANRALEQASDARSLKNHTRVVEILEKFVLQEEKITEPVIRDSIRKMYNPSKFEVLLEALKTKMRFGSAQEKIDAFTSYESVKKQISPLTEDQKSREREVIRDFEKERERLAWDAFVRLDPGTDLERFLKSALDLVNSYANLKSKTQSRVREELKKLLPAKSDKGFAELKFVTLSFNRKKIVGYFAKPEGFTDYWYWKQANKDKYDKRVGPDLSLTPGKNFVESEPQPILEVKLVKEWNDERDKALLTISRASIWMHLLSVCQNAEKELKALREAEGATESRISFDDARKICEKVVANQSVLEGIFR